MRYVKQPSKMSLPITSAQNALKMAGSLFLIHWMMQKVGVFSVVHTANQRFAMVIKMPLAQSTQWVDFGQLPPLEMGISLVLFLESSHGTRRNPSIAWPGC